MLLDVDDVGLRYVTKMRWNESGTWIWSENVAHAPIIDRETFDQAQAMLAGRASRHAEHKPHRSARHTGRKLSWTGSRRSPKR